MIAWRYHSILLVFGLLRGSKFLFVQLSGTLFLPVEDKLLGVFFHGFLRTPSTSTMSNREYDASSPEDDDDKKLESLGYVPSFKREFSNLATVRGSYLSSFLYLMDNPHTQISFAFSIMVCLPLRMRDNYISILLIGPLLICRNHIQYPAAFGGACISTSTNTDIHFYDSIKVISHKGDVVLDSWGDHVFHFGQVVPYVLCDPLHES